MDPQASQDYRTDTLSRGMLVAGALYFASLLGLVCALVG